MLLLTIVEKCIQANPPPVPDVSAQSRNEAKQYADFMVRFLDQVHKQYYPKTDEIDLFVAAVQGLYEAARQPLPPNLREEFRRPNPEALLTRLRADLGNHEALRNPRDRIASANALKRVLDPYCGIPAAREFRMQFDRQVSSIGIEFANGPIPAEPGPIEIQIQNGVMQPRPRVERSTSLPDTLLVKTVIAGSPAQRAGIRPGDLITMFDGKPCSSMDPLQYQNLFATSSSNQVFVPAGFADSVPNVPVKSVKAEIRRNNDTQPLIVSLEPNQFGPESVFGARRHTDDSWDYMIDYQAKLGYVRIGSIILPTDDDFRRALASLQAQGTRGMILDLRWCPGGFLIEAMSTAMSVLPPDTPIAQCKYKNPENHTEQPNPVANPVTDLPIIVLINGETMGGGELIAAALQDHGRAMIAGERTFGKGSIQASLNNANIAGQPFKLTQGMFVRPNGKNLQRFSNSTNADDWGVRPDQGRWLPLSPDAARQLKEQWILQSLRPGKCRDALASDDPDNDPQLRAALAMLRNKLKN